jgi:hypothetical protein
VVCAAIVIASAACTRTSPAADGGSGSASPLEAAVVDEAAAHAPAHAGSAMHDGTEGTAVGLPASVTLLEPGRPPLRLLRYRWRLDQHEQLTMDLRTTASTDEGDGRAAAMPPLPSVRIVVAIDPTSVSTDGDLRYAWHVTSTEVGADAGAPDSVVAGMRAEVAAIAALAGSGVVTARGLAREVTLDATSLVETGATGQMVEQVRQTLRDVAAPFPEEAVGVGARWQKLSEVASNEARVAQTETFTLTDIKPARGTVHNVLAQTAPAQALRAAGMPAGAQARMESMLVSADAKTTFDPSRLVPETHLRSTTTMVLSGHSPGDSTRRVGMVLRVEIVIAGRTL